MSKTSEEARRVSRRLLGALGILALVFAAFAPMPTAEQLASWDDKVMAVAGVVVTIAAIWLGMMFGVAVERAKLGRNSGASELLEQLLRPLKAGGTTLILALVLSVATPYIIPQVLRAPYDEIVQRARVFVSLALWASAVYGLLLSLAPVYHIIAFLRDREAEADAMPPAEPVPPYMMPPSEREPWRG